VSRMTAQPSFRTGTAEVIRNPFWISNQSWILDRACAARPE